MLLNAPRHPSATNRRHDSWCLAVMAKAPEPGFAKTRLCPPLTPRAAAQIHRRLTDGTLAWTARCTMTSLQLWCAPDRHHAYFRRLGKQHPLTLHDQCRGNLGRRLDQVVRANVRRYDKIIIIGTDCPTLSQRDLTAALTALERVDVALSPAYDGGYVLIALRCHVPGIFGDIAWGGAQVLRQQRQRLHERGLSTTLLDAHRDIDRHEDLLAWQHPEHI